MPTSNADNLPYAFHERLADGTVRNITDELPFDIPESWEWVRLGDLVETITSGSRDWARFYTSSGARFLRMGNLSRNSFALRLEKIQHVSLPKKAEGTRTTLLEDDLLFSITGEVGLMGLIPPNFGEAYINQHTAMIRFLPALRGEFLPSVLLTDYAQKYYKKTQHGIKNSFRLDSIAEILIPLPPISEQHRIVERIEKLLPHITDYDIAEQKLTALNASFPTALKKSILQAAVQGKLVAQNPADEPASVLLERIRAEKEALIKAGKIKRNKHESVIFRRDNSHYEIRDGVETCIDEDLPFDIPDSWEWVCLDSICEYIQRGKSPKYSLIKKYPVIAQKCNQWSGFSIEKAQFIDPSSLASYADERLLKDDDLLWNSTGLGTLGRMAVYKKALNPYELAVADSHVTVIRPLKNFVLPMYLYAYFANPSVQSVIEAQSDGTTKQKELATATIKCYHVPLPPMEEQVRIIREIGRLLICCSKIA